MKESEIILYTTPNGEVKIDIRFDDETFWLTQQKIADLFEVDRTSISRHLANIFEDGELHKDVVCAKYAHTTKHGAIKAKLQKTETTYYNLDAIIAVCYRVNSFSATQFRIWATKTLKEFIIKGFVMDDERLKQGQSPFAPIQLRHPSTTLRVRKANKSRAKRSRSPAMKLQQR